jgi:hypothetical protein
MIDFSHLKRFDITSETLAEYVFNDIPGSPSVWLAPATDSNEVFMNERIRMALERAEKGKKRPRGGFDMSAATIEEDRETDRTLLAKCCARKWGTAPLDAKGKAPEFSTSNCYEFFKALPNWMFDPLRGWAANIYNFVDASPADGDGPEALGNE